MPLSRPVPNRFTAFLLVIAGIGFIDAAFLTVEHYMNKIPPCFVGGCETVLTSSYSKIAGIPVSLLGVIFYLLFLILLISYLDGKKEKFLRFALLLTIPGFLATVYFFILQAFVLHSYCQYCLISAGTSTILFIISIIIFCKFTRQTDIPTVL